MRIFMALAFGVAGYLSAGWLAGLSLAVFGYVLSTVLDNALGLGTIEKLRGTPIDKAVRLTGAVATAGLVAVLLWAPVKWTGPLALFVSGVVQWAGLFLLARAGAEKGS